MPAMKAHRNPNLIGHRGDNMNGQLAFPYHPPPPARRRVCDLPAEERPLYCLQQAGSGALSTTELLALVLGTAAAPGLSADLLDAFGSLHQLSRASKGQQLKVRGIGEAQAGRLLAMLELGRRLQLPPATERLRVASPADGANLLLGRMGHLQQEEYKGTPDGRTAISRVLSIAVKGDNVYLELKGGPGKLTPTGAITPNGLAEVEVNVAFKLYEARRLAASVLAYLQAWEVLRMLAHQRLVGQPSPYLLVPAGNGDNGVQPINGAALSHNGHDSGGNGRPVTRKDPPPARTRPAQPTPTRMTVQPLKYGAD